MTPTCLALLLCESVRREAASGNTSIIGTFQAFKVDSFPKVTRPFAVWLQLTDGHGEVPMMLVVERVPAHTPECETLIEVPFTLAFESPNTVREHTAVFEDGIALEHKGSYRLRLAAGGMTVLQRYFIAEAT